MKRATMTHENFFEQLQSMWREILFNSFSFFFKEGQSSFPIIISIPFFLRIIIVLTEKGNTLITGNAGS